MGKDELRNAALCNLERKDKIIRDFNSLPIEWNSTTIFKPKHHGYICAWYRTFKSNAFALNCNDVNHLCCNEMWKVFLQLLKSLQVFFSVFFFFSFLKDASNAHQFYHQKRTKFNKLPRHVMRLSRMATNEQVSRQHPTNRMIDIEAFLCLATKIKAQVNLIKKSQTTKRNEKKKNQTKTSILVSYRKGE